MALAAEVLERAVGGGDAADLRADLHTAAPARTPLFMQSRRGNASPTPVGSTMRFRGVTDATSVLRGPFGDQDGRAVLTAGDDQRVASWSRGSSRSLQSGLLLENLVLVVVADQNRGADGAVLEFVA